MKKLHFFPLFIGLSLLFIAQTGSTAFSATIFGDDEILSMTPANSSVFVDLKEQNKIDIRFKKDVNDKSLADFSDFLRDSRNVYFAVWIIRIIQVNALDIYTIKNSKRSLILLKGYNLYTSAFGSFAQSALYEYTIEGAIQSPSIQDLIVTPGIGVPVGMVLEETSDWLVSRDSGFLNAVGYIVNPMKIIVPERDKVNVGPIISGQVVIGFQW